MKTSNNLIKIFSMVLIILTIIMLTGCTGNGGLNDKNNINTNYRTGSTGLTFEFGVETPPNQVFEKNQFTVGLLLENEGATSIVGGKMVLTFEDDYMGVSSGFSEFSFDLYGKDEYRDGERKLISTPVFAKEFPETLSERHTSLILATACYSYETKAATSVCVDMDPNNVNSKDKVCQRQDRALGSQGGPVAVTLIEEHIMIEEDVIRPFFIIHLKNIGDGQVINKSSVNFACSSNSVPRSDWNVVELVEVTFSKYKMSTGEIVCEPRPLRLENDEDTIKCWLRDGIMSNQDTFQSYLSVDLAYGYTESISKSVNIEKISTY